MNNDDIVYLGELFICILDKDNATRFESPLVQRGPDDHLLAMRQCKM